MNNNTLLVVSRIKSIVNELGRFNAHEEFNQSLTDLRTKLDTAFTSYALLNQEVVKNEENLSKANHMVDQLIARIEEKQDLVDSFDEIIEQISAGISAIDRNTDGHLDESF